MGQREDRALALRQCLGDVLVAHDREVGVDRAVAHARSVDGVKRVENYVVLKNDPVRYGFAASSPPQ